jgi:hypothetical protein
MRHCLTRLVQKRAKEFSQNLLQEDGLTVGTTWFEKYCLANKNPGVTCTWLSDQATSTCMNEKCGKPFTFFFRKHHCRSCGNIFCEKCVQKKKLLNFGTEEVYCCLECRNLRGL